MSVFWTVAALMLISALAFLLPPLLRRDQQAPVERDALNARIYQDQLTELENDLAVGNLSADQFEQAARDLQRKLLEDATGDVEGRAPAKGSTTSVAGGTTPGMEEVESRRERRSRMPAPAMEGSVSREAEPAPDSIRGRRERLATVEEKRTAPAGGLTGRMTAVAVALAVPLFSIALYLQLDHVRENPAAQAAGGFSPEMMVQRLEQRLKDNPADTEGWLMLARSYSVLQRYPEARDAYAKALPLLDGNADLLADYAESIVLSHPEQRITQQSADLFQKTLRINSNQPKALWFTGVAAFQDGDYQSAVTIWRRLEKLIPDDVEGVQVIRQGIAEAEARVAQGAARAP